MLLIVLIEVGDEVVILFFLEIFGIDVGCLMWELEIGCEMFFVVNIL